MRINEILTESAVQELNEGPIGRAIGRGVGGLARGVGAVAGGIGAIPGEIKKGYKSGAAAVRGEPDDNTAPRTGASSGSTIGRTGTPGKTGVSGAPEKDGAAGAPGADGAPGKTGVSGATGSTGTATSADGKVIRLADIKSSLQGMNKQDLNKIKTAIGSRLKK